MNTKLMKLFLGVGLLLGFAMFSQASAEVLGSALFEEDETSGPKSKVTAGQTGENLSENGNLNEAVMPAEQVADSDLTPLLPEEGTEVPISQRMYKGETGLSEESEEPYPTVTELATAEDEEPAIEEVAISEESAPEQAVNVEEIATEEPMPMQTSSELEEQASITPSVPDVAPLEPSSPELQGVERDVEEQVPATTSTEVVPAEQPKKSWWKFWTWWS